MGQPMQYMFYVDVKFNDRKQYQDMITAIRPLLNKIHILGEYMEGSKSWEKMHGDDDNQQINKSTNQQINKQTNQQINKSTK